MVQDRQPPFSLLIYRDNKISASKEETPTRHENWGGQKQEIPNQDVQDESCLLYTFD
jgi:hypothetical protein